MSAGSPRTGEERPSGAERAQIHRIEVPRTARYLTLGPPDAPERWIVVHGYGQLARRFLRRFASIDDGSRRIVAPEALSRFYVGNERGRHGPGSVVGGTWMTREAREEEIADYVRYLDLLADREAPDGRELTVLGFSQGVATAARWVSFGRVRPARVVLWADFLPPDLPAEVARARLRRTELILVRGEEDGAVADPERAAAEDRQRAEAGLEPRLLTYVGGHDIDPALLQRIAGETVRTRRRS